MGLLMKRTPFPRILRFDSVRIVFLQVLCERNLKTEVSKSFEAFRADKSVIFLQLSGGITGRLQWFTDCLSVPIRKILDIFSRKITRKSIL